MNTSPITIDARKSPEVSHSASPPISMMSPNMRWIVDAMVTSRIGSDSTPWRIIRPSAPTEKSPDTGFTPECRPTKLLM